MAELKSMVSMIRRARRALTIAVDLAYDDTDIADLVEVKKTLGKIVERVNKRREEGGY